LDLAFPLLAQVRIGGFAGRWNRAKFGISPQYRTATETLQDRDVTHIIYSQAPVAFIMLSDLLQAALDDAGGLFR